ncbi:MAG: response regulator [Chitinophagaceae bacterium]
MKNEPAISKSLVVVEDDPDDQFFLKSAFEKIGFADYVMWLDSSVTLFEYLRTLDSDTGYPYTILLDYNLPIMNGEEILNELKKHPGFRQIPVLIYSTGISKQLIHKLIALGADGCYVKSYSSSGILEFAEFLKKKIANAVFR